MAVFYNQASLSHNGNVTLSNITAGEIVETLAATKEAVIDSYTSDSQVTYIITVVNSGTVPFTDLTLTDDLGSYTFGEQTAELVPLDYQAGSISYYVNGVKQADPTVTDTSPLTVTGISVPAGGNAVIAYAAKVNEYAPLGEGAGVTNNVEVSSVSKAVLAAASETITHEQDAELTVTKSLSPAVVSENGELTYTFVISNSGSTPVAETDSTVLTDVFDPVLNITSVTFNGTTWAEGVNYTYEQASGTFTTIDGQITVPAASYTQDAATGSWSVQPGTATITVTGTVV